MFGINRLFVGTNIALLIRLKIPIAQKFKWTFCFNKIQRVFGVASMFELQIETVSSRVFFDTVRLEIDVYASVGGNSIKILWKQTFKISYGSWAHIYKLLFIYTLFVYRTPTLTQLSQQRIH